MIKYFTRIQLFNRKSIKYFSIPCQDMINYFKRDLIFDLIKSHDLYKDLYKILLFDRLVEFSFIASKTSA
jgi:hypothetical protein